MNMDRRELLKRSGIVGVGAIAASRGGTGRVAAADPKTMVFWDVLNTEPRLSIMDKVATRYSEAHSGMKSEHRGMTLEELTDQLPRTLESKQGPDVAQVNNGESLMGPMVRAKQILPLDDYSKQYGWDKLLPEGLRARNMYSEDGKTFGEGKLWGVSCETEIVGFFYNRTKFKDIGLEVPKTLADFETVLKKLKEAGEQPLVLGNMDKSPAIHLFGEIHGALTTREYIDDIIYRRNDKSFSDPSIIDAATKLQEWKNNGYLMEGFEGMKADDATAYFGGGEGGIMVQGSWAAANVAEGLKDDAGFFLMPPKEAGQPVMNVGGVGIPYSITVNAEDPKAAAELLNTIVSDETLTAFLDAGILPAGEIPADRIKPDTLAGDLYTSWNDALKADAIGHYMDWAAPGFYDVLAGELQKLLAGEVDPKTFSTTLQDFYAKSFA